MDPKIKTLRKVSVFQSMTDAHLEEVARISAEKSYLEKQVIFHQNEPGSALFILKTGTAKISVIDHEGKEAILKMIYENDFFGEMSLLDGCFRSATVTAIENCKALVIHREDFVRLIRDNQSVVLDMLTVLCRRLRKTDEAIASLTFHGAYGKVAKVLLDLADAQGKRLKKIIIVNLKISPSELSGMAGVTREVFSRVLKEFEVRGYVRVEKESVIVLDEAALKREVL